MGQVAHEEFRALALYLEDDESEAERGMNMVLAGSVIMWATLSGQTELIDAVNRKKAHKPPNSEPYPEQEDDLRLIRRKTHWYIVDHRKDQFVEYYTAAINKALELNVGLAFNEYVNKDATRRTFIDIEFEDDKCHSFNSFLQINGLGVNQLYQGLRLALARTLSIPDQDVNDQTIALDVRVRDRLHMFVLLPEYNSENKIKQAEVLQQFERYLYEQYPGLPKTLIRGRTDQYKTIVDVGATKSLRPSGAGKVKSTRAFSNSENYYYKPYKLDQFKDTEQDRNDIRQVSQGIGPYTFSVAEILNRMLWVKDGKADEIFEQNSRAGRRGGSLIPNVNYIRPEEVLRRPSEPPRDHQQIQGHPVAAVATSAAAPFRRHSVGVSPSPGPVHPPLPHPSSVVRRASMAAPMTIPPPPPPSSYSQPIPIRRVNNTNNYNAVDDNVDDLDDNVSIRSGTTNASNRSRRTSSVSGGRGGRGAQAQAQAQAPANDKPVNLSMTEKEIHARMKLRKCHSRIQQEGILEADADDQMEKAIKDALLDFLQRPEIINFYHGEGLGTSFTTLPEEQFLDAPDIYGDVRSHFSLRVKLLDGYCPIQDKRHRRTVQNSDNTTVSVSITKLGIQVQCSNEECHKQYLPTRRIKLTQPRLLRYIVGKNVAQNSLLTFQKYDCDHGFEAHTLFQRLKIPFELNRDLVYRMHHALEHQNAQFTINLLTQLFNCGNERCKRLSIIAADKGNPVFWIYEDKRWREYSRENFRHYCRLLLQGLLILYNEIYLIPRGLGFDDASFTDLVSGGGGMDEENENEEADTIEEQVIQGGYEDPITGQTIPMRQVKKRRRVSPETMSCYKLWNQFTKIEFLNSTITTLVDKLTLHNKRDPLPDKLDTKRRFLSFNDHVYDLETEQLVHDQPDQYCAKTLGYDYIDPDVEVWQHPLLPFVIRMFRNFFPRRDIHDFVWLILSRSIGLDTPEWIVIAPGGGNNGKSFFVMLLMFLFGDYWGPFSSTMLSNARTDVGKPQPELFALNGLRMVTTQEPEANRKFNAANVKNRFDIQVARTMFSGKMEKLKHTYGHWVMTNDVPDCTDTTKGFSRRIIFIEFAMNFVAKPDPKVPLECAYDNMLTADVLREMAPVVMALILYYRKYEDRKLPHQDFRCPAEDKVPLYSQQYKEQYMNENNTLQEWMDEYCERSHGLDPIPLKAFQKNLDKWWKNKYRDTEQNSSRKPRMIVIRTSLESKFKTRARKIAGKEWEISNIRLKDQPEFNGVNLQNSHANNNSNNTTTNSASAQEAQARLDRGRLKSSST